MDALKLLAMTKYKAATTLEIEKGFDNKNEKKRTIV